MHQLKGIFIGAFAILLTYYAGVFLSSKLSLPIPGSLIGLVLLLSLLFVFPKTEKHIALVSQPLLKHMSVMFVPAVLGVGVYWSDIEANAVAIVTAIGGTTALSLGLTAWVSNKLMAKKRDHSYVQSHDAGNNGTLNKGFQRNDTQNNKDETAR